VRPSPILPASLTMAAMAILRRHGATLVIAALAAAASGREAPALTTGTGGGPAEADARALFERFVVAQNAHDAAAVEALLWDSSDFLWITRALRERLRTLYSRNLPVGAPCWRLPRRLPSSCLSYRGATGPREQLNAGKACGSAPTVPAPPSVEPGSGGSAVMLPPGAVRAWAAMPSALCCAPRPATGAQPRR
jgi:hypothetical protein